jgi:hypothetical protein
VTNECESGLLSIRLIGLLLTSRCGETICGDENAGSWAGRAGAGRAGAGRAGAGRAGAGRADAGKAGAWGAVAAGRSDLEGQGGTRGHINMLESEMQQATGRAQFERLDAVASADFS